jgi:hypothetical protein
MILFGCQFFNIDSRHFILLFRVLPQTTGVRCHAGTQTVMPACGIVRLIFFSNISSPWSTYVGLVQVSTDIMNRLEMHVQSNWYEQISEFYLTYDAPPDHFPMLFLYSPY